MPLLLIFYLKTHVLNLCNRIKDRNLQIAITNPARNHTSFTGNLFLLKAKNLPTFLIIFD